MQSLQARLDLTNGRPSGFDYLRIALATSVIFFHSMDLRAGHNVAFVDFHGALQPFSELILPMFFGLSGFLVSGSLERSKTLISFLGLRVIRLSPALFVETVFSAIVIGLIFTTLSYKAYFSNTVFASYFLNIVGDVHFYLPGVFKTHPDTAVNRQLWTVPWELWCYGVLAVLATIGIAKRKYLMLSATVIFNAAVLIHHAYSHNHGPPYGIHGIILVLSFLYGICLYSFRASIPWSRWLAFAALVVFLILATRQFSAWGNYLIPIPGAYLTVFLGLANPRRSKIIASGDYSYGIYLYGFPVQQSVISIFGHPLMPSWLNFSISMAVVTPLAIGSWHLVEKHAAQFRGALFAFEKRFIVMRAKLLDWLRSKLSSVAEEDLEPEPD